MFPDYIIDEIKEYIEGRRSGILPVPEDMDEESARELSGGLCYAALFFKLYDAKIASGEIVFSRIGMSKAEFTVLCGDGKYISDREQVIKLCFTLMLSPGQAAALMQAAGYGFAAASDADMIAEYLISNGIKSYEGYQGLLEEFGLA